VSRDRRIGGQLDLQAYERLTQRFRPRDAESLAGEARRLRRAGHSSEYIAAHLRLPLEVVDKALAEQTAK
jgi:hypothetical protein